MPYHPPSYLSQKILTQTAQLILNGLIPVLNLTQFCLAFSVGMNFGESKYSRPKRPLQLLIYLYDKGYDIGALSIV